MPFDWRELLIIAKELSNDPSEGAQRTCINRTYYYVYNLAIMKAQDLGFRERPPGLHKKVWTWCQSQSNKNVRQLGAIGKRLHSLRVEADYNIETVPALRQEVKMQLARAVLFEDIVARIISPT